MGVEEPEPYFASAFSAPIVASNRSQYNVSQMEMTNMPVSVKKTLSQNSRLQSQAISVAEAKAHLSAVLSHVEKKKKPITIVRRGVPIAQIVPISAIQPVSGYGWMRGTVQELGDIVGPTGIEWTAGDE